MTRLEEYAAVLRTAGYRLSLQLNDTCPYYVVKRDSPSSAPEFAFFLQPESERVRLAPGDTMRPWFPLALRQAADGFDNLKLAMEYMQVFHDQWVLMYTGQNQKMRTDWGESIALGLGLPEVHDHLRKQGCGVTVGAGACGHFLEVTVDPEARSKALPPPWGGPGSSPPTFYLYARSGRHLGRYAGVLPDDATRCYWPIALTDSDIVFDSLEALTSFFTGWREIFERVVKLKEALSR